MIIGAEFDRDVLEKSGRLRSKVDDDVEDRTAARSDQLAFRGWWILEVHSAQRALLAIEADVALGDYGLQPVRGELFLAERPREEAAVVVSSFQIDNEGAFELGFCKYHRPSCDVKRIGRGRTYQPTPQAVVIGASFWPVRMPVNLQQAFCFSRNSDLNPI
jgi:hypothetical protein